MEPDFSHSTAICRRPPVKPVREQPDDLGPACFDYGRRGAQVWQYWNGLTPDEEPTSGWKFHVTLMPESAYLAARAILPALRKMRVLHKIAPCQSYIRQVLNTSRQQGKVITIYTRDEQEAERVVNTIDPLLKLLKDIGVIEPGPRPRVYRGKMLLPETEVGCSGFLSGRYCQRF